MISAYFENRDFTPYIPHHWDKLEVDWYSKNVIGGPKAASINVQGTEQQLWEFVEMLRCPVYLSDERPERVWWGYIHEVEIHTEGGLVYGVSLDSMANNAAVCHTYQKDEAKTEYSNDSDSSDEYGTKDVNLRAREITSDLALQLRNTELARRKYPIPVIKGGSSGGSYAVLKCRGWYDTLDWRYYLQGSGKEAYEEYDSSYGSREIGEDNRPIAAQSFQLSSTSGWTASSIWLRVAKRGTPTDNLQVDLFDDSSSHPNATLTGGATTLAGGSINTYYEWTEFVLTSSVALSTSTTYWIHISRSGAVSTTNFYMIGGTVDLGYDNGSLKLWNGVVWSPWGIDSDLNFRVVGEAVTTTQISDAVTSIGQFFVGTNILDASGISNQQYRDGDQTGLYEIEQLLKTGTTNNRRLLANVTEKRILEVYEEPPKGEADYKINSKLDVFDEYDNLVPPTECPVGKWMRLKNVIPGSANVSRLSDPTIVFIEEARYNVKSGRWQPTKNRDDKPFLPVTLEEG